LVSLSKYWKREIERTVGVARQNGPATQAISSPVECEKGTMGTPHKIRELAQENVDRNSGQNWLVVDVEDLRDFAKTMTIDDLTVVMARSRHEIQKKLIELGLSGVKGGPNEAAER
jgi:hypothetical protein